MTTNLVPFDERTCDVLVVGGGAAGMLAAIEAHLAGAHVLLLTKSTFPSGSSSMARRGYAAAFGHADPRDNPDVHFEDTVKGGHGINNRRLVRVMVEEILERTRTIDSWGLGLVKGPDGKYDQEPSPGDAYPRLIHCAGWMGKSLMQTLSRKVKELGIATYANTFLVDLLKDASGRVVGAWGLRPRETQAVVVRAKSTVLCSGGAAQLHRVNDAPPQVSGDGYAMAFRAGAELIDMEMIDYMITIGWPEKLAGQPTRAFEFINAGARFLNRLGERFMKRYNPDPSDGVYERAPRAVFNLAIGVEIFEGRGTEHGCILLDARNAVDKIGPRGESFLRAFSNAGVDVRKEPIQLIGCPHTFLGGLRIDEFGRTTLPGLYAGGEAAGGVHGSSRLSGAALADSFVFGSRAGRTAAREAGERGLPDLQKEALEAGLASLGPRLSATEGMSPAGRRLALQENVFHNIGQVRTEERLLVGLSRLEELRGEPAAIPDEEETGRAYFRNLVHVIETENLIDVASLLATAALLRTESRGGHFRHDFPEKRDKDWRVNVVVSKGEKPGEIKTRIVPVDLCGGSVEPHAAAWL